MTGGISQSIFPIFFTSLVTLVSSPGCLFMGLSQSYKHKNCVATPTFEVSVILVYSGLSYGSMLDVNLLMVDPTNKPSTTNIAEKSQNGGHCESLHSTTF